MKFDLLIISLQFVVVRIHRKLVRRAGVASVVIAVAVNLSIMILTFVTISCVHGFSIILWKTYQIHSKKLKN